MVLQRSPNRAVIWGYAKYADIVYLKVENDMYNSTVKEGNWRVILDAYPAGGPHTITATTTHNKKSMSIKISNILFGDVWFCSGQSNMVMPLRKVFNGSEEISKSSHYPNIRLVSVIQHYSNTPQEELVKNKYALRWSIASPASTGGYGWTYFSAVCWMFGRTLYDRYKVPIGLISTAHGRSAIEAWVSQESLQECNVTRSIINSQSIGAFSILWNTLVKPFLNMTIKGVIWYQGESNAGEPYSNYECLFPAMIKRWRKDWYHGTGNNTDIQMPFGLVQLSSMGRDGNFYTILTTMYDNLQELRWKQTANYGYVPNPLQSNTFMATAIDLIDPMNVDPIHPRYKASIAERLSLGARALAYGEKVYWSGPIYSHYMLINPSPNIWYLHIYFKPESIGSDGLQQRSTAGVEVQFVNKTTNIETKWISYDIASFQNNLMSIRVWKFEESNFFKLRYNWKSEPCEFKRCALYSNGLPALPFIAVMTEVYTQ